MAHVVTISFPDDPGLPVGEILTFEHRQLIDHAGYVLQFEERELLLAENGETAGRLRADPEPIGR